MRMCRGHRFNNGALIPERARSPYDTHVASTLATASAMMATNALTLPKSLNGKLEISAWRSIGTANMFRFVFAPAIQTFDST